MQAILDQFGEATVMTAIGVLLGAVFGFAAYQSRFCLRAAAVAVASGQFGPRLAIWLVAFATAVICVQGAQWVGWLELHDTRQLSGIGSISGALLGGLLFGFGMILARGCVSRLLVLSASGNLRAIVTGLVVTLAAQASLRGVLTPLRETLAGLWLLNDTAMRHVLGTPTETHGWVVTLAGAGVIGALALGPGLCRAGRCCGLRGMATDVLGVASLV